MLVWIFLMCTHKIIFFRIHISGQFSCSVVPDSLWPHGLQHARPPCPSATPEAYSDSCPLSRWCHPNISSSVIPFSSCLQSFPASGSFPMSQLSASGGQWTPRADLLQNGLVGQPCSPRTLKSLLQHHSSKASILQCSAFFIVQLSHPYMIHIWEDTKSWFIGKNAGSSLLHAVGYFSVTLK